MYSNPPGSRPGANRADSQSNLRDEVPISTFSDSAYEDPDYLVKGEYVDDELVPASSE